MPKYAPQNDSELAAVMSAQIATERFVELAEAFGATDHAAFERAIAAIELRLVDRLTTLRDEFRNAGAGDNVIVMAVTPIRDMPIRLTHTGEKSSTARRIAATRRNTKLDMSRNCIASRPFLASAAQVAALEWVGRVPAQQFVAFYSPVCVNRIGMIRDMIRRAKEQARKAANPH
jgi:hypothetical protein